MFIVNPGLILDGSLCAPCSTPLHHSMVNNLAQVLCICLLFYIYPFKKNTLFIRHGKLLQEIVVFFPKCPFVMMRFLVQHIFTNLVNL